MRVDIERHDAIKRRLRAKRITFTKIAEELGITSVAITRVCGGHGRSERVEYASADKLGTTPQELWPDRY
ncbi:transcriptional regulator [Ochrobactrum cytisi]|nr:transcriptional regulator [Brucella cytisi]